MATRQCVVCGGEFRWWRRRGRPTNVCSPKCRETRRREVVARGAGRTDAARKERRVTKARLYLNKLGLSVDDLQPENVTETAPEPQFEPRALIPSTREKLITMHTNNAAEQRRMTPLSLNGGILGRITRRLAP